MTSDYTPGAYRSHMSDALLEELRNAPPEPAPTKHVRFPPLPTVQEAQAAIDDGKFGEDAVGLQLRDFSNDGPERFSHVELDTARLGHQRQRLQSDPVLETAMRVLAPDTAPLSAILADFHNRIAALEHQATLDNETISRLLETVERLSHIGEPLKLDGGEAKDRDGWPPPYDGPPAKTPR